MSATVKRASTVGEWFATYQERFNPDAAANLNAIIQYDIQGEGGGKWHMVFQNKAVALIDGTHQTPAVTMKISADDYVKLAQGEANGMMLYLTGRMKLDGNRDLAVKLQDLFPKSKIISA